MSKAFTNEEDEGEVPLEGPELPPGIKNYITTAGAARMRQEFEQSTRERGRLSNETVEGQWHLRVMDQHLRFLASRLDTLVPLDPTQQPKDEVRFGASVSVADASGSEQTWRIVGLDEVDLDKGWISWMSPLATVLLAHRVGDVIPFQNSRLTIRAIRYSA